MTNSEKLLNSLYGIIFFAENLNILLLDNNEFSIEDINSIRNMDFTLLKNKDTFLSVYSEIKKYDINNEMYSLKKINIDEMLEEFASLDIIKHDFKDLKIFNNDLKNKVEGIINQEIDSIHIILLETELLNKMKNLYKSVVISKDYSFDDIIREIEKSYQTHKETKFKLSLLHNINYMNDSYNSNMSNKEVNGKTVEELKKIFLDMTNLFNGKNSSNPKKFYDNLINNKNENKDFDFEDISLEDAINDQYKLLNVVKCEEKFEDIIGLDKIKKELEKLAILYKENEDDLKKHKISRDKGFILYGEPGTGKTMLCKAFANVMGGIFVYLSMEQFISKKNEEVSIAKLFEEVDMLSQEYTDSNIVLFLDEIDSLRGRGQSEHNNSYYDGFTNEMLYRIDNLPKNVMIIGATNNITTLDDALVRKGRLGNKYEVKNDFTKEQIIKHINHYFTDAKMGLLNKYDKEISTMIYYMNGSEIANIVNKIKQNYYFKKKFKEKGTLRNMIVDTIYSEKYNIAEYKLTPEEEISTAYHEAGHAILYMKYYGTNKLHEISIYPTSKTLGFVSYKFDKNEITKDDLKKLTIIALAGRYGEKLITNNISIGAISDLEKANKNIESIISKYGMGNLTNINKSRKDASDYMLTKMDKEHEIILDAYSKETQIIIEDNKELVKEIALDLIKNKVIIDDFQKYFLKLK